MTSLSQCSMQALHGAGTSDQYSDLAQAMHGSMCLIQLHQEQAAKKLSKNRMDVIHDVTLAK